MNPLYRNAWLTLLLVSFLGNGVTAMAAEVWGEADGGLQMSLSASSANSMTLSLRNTSKQDKMLSIGFMAAAPSVATTVGGKTKVGSRTIGEFWAESTSNHYQFPNAITLVVQDAAGKATELKVKEPGAGNGIIEPMEVPLPPGAVYSFQTQLSEYFDRKTFGPLPNGKGAVQITAKYVWQDGESRTNRCYWTGSLKSNTVSMKL